MKQWAAYIGLVGAAFAAGFQIGTERTTLKLEQAAFRAESQGDAIVDSLRQALAARQRKADTVWKTVTKYRVAVDTAWAQVPESVFVALPELETARDACLGLATACEQARLAHEQERTAWNDKAKTDSLQIARLRQAWAQASEQVQTERDKAWRRRIEGMAGAVVIGIIGSRLIQQ